MKSCCIEGCKALKKDVTLFELPTSRLLRKRWLDAINPPIKLASDALVCSRHFAVEDYEDVRGKIRLKGKVVPTLFGDEAQNPKDPHKEPLEDPLGLPDNNTENKEPPESTDKETANNDNRTTDNGKIDNDNENIDNHNEKVENSDGENNLISSCNATENGHNKNTDNGKSDSENVVNYNRNVDKVDKDNGKVVDKSVAEVKVGSKRVKTKWVPMRECVNLNGSFSEDSSSQDSINSDLPPSPVLEDLEEHLPNYQIANMKTERQVAAMTDTIDPNPAEETTVEDVESVLVEPHVPVFIELSVGQDNTLGSSEANDCLMVIESVQCDIDPTLMLEARAEEDDCTEHIDLDDEEEEEKPLLAEVTEKRSADPISLLTSSDEDDVILQEPHIDTLSVSDETDEDDLPLHKLMKREKKAKKLKKKKKKTESIKSILVGVTDFYCMHCQHVSLSKSAHDKHVKTHLKADSEQSRGTTRVYQICKECGFTTSSKSQLVRHQRKHLNEKRFKCPLCSYRSKYNMSLMYHLKTHHLDPNVYNCGACGLQCDNKKTLLDHQGSCFALNEKFPCGACGFEARTRRALKIHRNTAHKRKV